MDNTSRPWWAPDMQTALALGIVGICGSVVFVRIFKAAPPVDDKILDTMITILFSTCLVTVYNYSFGSSRGSQAKDDTQNKIVEKLTATEPAGTPGPIAPAPAAVTPAGGPFVTPLSTGAPKL